MVDWGAGAYETTAAELEPVAAAVVSRAALAAGDDVLDLLAVLAMRRFWRRRLERV
jgi:hypothetical protein